MFKVFKVIIFLLIYWLPRYILSPFVLAKKIITRKKVNPIFIRYTLREGHSDFSYWLACALISFTPGTIGVDYDETHVLVHLFDSDDEDSVTDFLNKFQAALK